MSNTMTVEELVALMEKQGITRKHLENLLTIAVIGHLWEDRGTQVEAVRDYLRANPKAPK